MEAFICTACGTQYTPSSVAPRQCVICEEERQYVPPRGQTWTTLAALTAGHFNSYRQYEPGVIGIGTQPQFAIGQRALVPHGSDGLTFLPELRRITPRVRGFGCTRIAGATGIERVTDGGGISLREPGTALRNRALSAVRAAIRRMTGYGTGSCTSNRPSSLAAPLNKLVFDHAPESLVFSDLSVIIFHRNVPASVVRHESCRCQTDDRANGDVDGDRIARAIGGKQRCRDQRRRPASNNRCKLIAQ